MYGSTEILNDLSVVPVLDHWTLFTFLCLWASLEVRTGYRCIYKTKLCRYVAWLELIEFKKFNLITTTIAFVIINSVEFLVYIWKKSHKSISDNVSNLNMYLTKIKFIMRQESPFLSPQSLIWSTGTNV